MGYKVEITTLANRDLVDILDYIQSREADSQRAVRFTEALLDEALGLGELPYRGRLMNRRQKIRRLVFGNYLILFEIREREKRVVVLRFVHGATLG